MNIGLDYTVDTQSMVDAQKKDNERLQGLATSMQSTVLNALNMPQEQPQTQQPNMSAENKQGW